MVRGRARSPWALLLVALALGAQAGVSRAEAPRGAWFSAPVTAIPSGSPTTPYGSPYWPSGIPHQGEPRVLAARNGDIYLSAHFQPFDCTTGGHSEFPRSCVWKSTNGGRTFRISGGDPSGQMGDDVDLAELPNGDVLQLAMTNISPPGQTNGALGTTVAISSDRGATWTDRVDANNQAGNDRPFFLVDGKNVLLTYSVIPLNNFVSISTDGGRSFGAPVPVTPLTSTQVSSGNGVPSVDAARGELLVPYFYNTDSAACYTATGGCLDSVGVARSRDHGQTWSQEPIVDLPGQHSVEGVLNIVADDAGHEYAALADTDPVSGRTSVVVFRQDRAGAPWLRTAAVDVPATSAMLPFIVAGRDGHVAVAWYRSEYADAYRTARPWTVDAAFSQDGGRHWTRQPVSEAAVWVGAGANHKIPLWDLLGVSVTNDHRVFVCWTAQPPPASNARIDCARQSSGPQL